MDVQFKSALIGSAVGLAIISALTLAVTIAGSAHKKAWDKGVTIPHEIFCEDRGGVKFLKSVRSSEALFCNDGTHTHVGVGQ